MKNCVLSAGPFHITTDGFQRVLSDSVSKGVAWKAAAERWCSADRGTTHGPVQATQVFNMCSRPSGLRPGVSSTIRRISVSPVIQFTVGQWESHPPAPLPGAGFPRVTDLCPYSTPGNPSRERKHSLFQIVSQQLRMFLVLLLSQVDLWLLSCSWVCFLNNSTVIVFLQVLPQAGDLLTFQVP